MDRQNSITSRTMKRSRSLSNKSNKSNKSNNFSTPKRITTRATRATRATSSPQSLISLGSMGTPKKKRMKIENEIVDPEWNEKMTNFSHDHYSFINQIFGDETVREIISEIYPNNDYNFNIEPPNSQGEFHHNLIKTQSSDKNTVLKFCSVDTAKIQNTNINKNDTLCQSYSLLEYLHQPIDMHDKTAKDKMQSYRNQMQIIQMYKTILRNPKFISEFKNIVNHNKKQKRFQRLWKYKNKGKGKTQYIFLWGPDKILEKIHNVLDDWQEFGYSYFIGTGEKPFTPES